VRKWERGGIRTYLVQEFDDEPIPRLSAAPYGPPEIHLSGEINVDLCVRTLDLEALLPYDALPVERLESNPDNGAGPFDGDDTNDRAIESFTDECVQVDGSESSRIREEPDGPVWAAGHELGALNAVVKSCTSRYGMRADPIPSTRWLAELETRAYKEDVPPVILRLSHIHSRRVAKVRWACPDLAVLRLQVFRDELRGLEVQEEDIRLVVVEGGDGDL
jgi:hypothetical protein